MDWNPSPSELAAQWISEQIAYGKGKENPPAIDRVIQMGLDNPRSLWPFILEVASQTDDHDTLEILGAGLLEDLGRGLGAEYFDRIEVQYRRSPTFREALSHVWIGGGDRHLVPLYSKLGCQIIGGR